MADLGLGLGVVDRYMSVLERSLRDMLAEPPLPIDREVGIWPAPVNFLTAH